MPARFPAAALAPLGSVSRSPPARRKQVAAVSPESAGLPGQDLEDLYAPVEGSCPDTPCPHLPALQKGVGGLWLSFAAQAGFPANPVFSRQGLLLSPVISCCSMT